jgi:hypothetical protein
VLIYPKNINLDIATPYSLSDIVNKVETRMFRKDQSRTEHNIEGPTTWTGTQLNDSNLVFTVTNTSNKPAILSTDNKVTVSTNKGCEIRVDWKKDGIAYKDYDIASYTSEVKRTSINISPSIEEWYTRVAPEIKTTVTLVGQNLKYAYDADPTNFLIVYENDNTSHGTYFNPGISSNKEGTYSKQQTYTDSGHVLGEGVHQASRTYTFKFGDLTKSFTAKYIGRYVESVSISDKCVIVNETYQDKIATTFNATCINMFKNDDYNNLGDYGEVWTSEPSGSTISSDGYGAQISGTSGSRVSGSLTLNTKSLSNNTNVKITVSRDGDVVSGNNTIKVAKITGVTVSISTGPKASVTFTGQNLKCAGNITISISKEENGTYTTLKTVTASNDTSNTVDNISYNDSANTYYGGVDKWFKVSIGSGNEAEQYGTYKVAKTAPNRKEKGVENALVLSVSNVYGNPNPIAYNSSTSTMYWTGVITGYWEDGTSKVLSSNQYNQRFDDFGTRYHKEGSVSQEKTYTWSVSKSTYGTTKDYSLDVTHQWTHNPDTKIPGTCVYSGLSYNSSVGCTASNKETITANGTATATWGSDGANAGTTSCSDSTTVQLSSNANNANAKTYTGTLQGYSYTITQAADEVLYGDCAYSKLTYYKGSGRIADCVNLASNTSCIIGACETGTFYVDANGVRQPYWKYGGGTNNLSPVGCTSRIQINVSSTNEGKSSSERLAASGNHEGLTYLLIQDKDTMSYSHNTWDTAENNTVSACTKVANYNLKGHKVYKWCSGQGNQQYEAKNETVTYDCSYEFSDYNLSGNPNNEKTSYCKNASSGNVNFTHYVTQSANTLQNNIGQEITYGNITEYPEGNIVSGCGQHTISVRVSKTVCTKKGYVCSGTIKEISRTCDTSQYATGSVKAIVPPENSTETKVTSGTWYPASGISRSWEATVNLPIIRITKPASTSYSVTNYTGYSMFTISLAGTTSLGHRYYTCDGAVTLPGSSSQTSSGGSLNFTVGGVTKTVTAGSSNSWNVNTSGTYTFTCNSGSPATTTLNGETYNVTILCPEETSYTPSSSGGSCSSCSTCISSTSFECMTINSKTACKYKVINNGTKDYVVNIKDPGGNITSITVSANNNANNPLVINTYSITTPYCP